MVREDKQRGTDSEDVRSLLLKAGISLFTEKGYAGTSVREIVERAGVSKPVLYYYFKSKEGLFQDIMQYTAELLEALILETIETPGSTQDRIIHLCRKAYEGVLEQRNLFTFIHTLLFGPSQDVPACDVDLYRRRMVDTIETIYREGVDLNEVKELNPEDVSGLVLGTLDLCIHLDCLCSKNPDPNRPERLLRMAFEGLLK